MLQKNSAENLGCQLFLTAVNSQVELEKNERMAGASPKTQQLLRFAESARWGEYNEADAIVVDNCVVADGSFETAIKNAVGAAGNKAVCITETNECQVCRN